MKSSAVRIVVAILVVLAWLGVAGVGGPTFGKLGEVSSNDQATFLPATAESTKAGEFVSRFRESNEIPALVVGTFDEAFSPQQIPELGALVDDLNSVEGVDTVIGPIPSEDMKAVQYIALINTDEVEPSGAVEELRALVADDANLDGVLADTTLHVTGPAGISADLGSAFAGIDGILLAVALAVVLIILLVVYRALFLPFIVILTSMVALTGAIVATYWMAKAGIVALNGQSQGILSILVIGAATDYGLLLVARQREELLRTPSMHEATKAAVKGSFGAITASASTVAIALLILLFSDLNSNASLGPIAAVGIVFAWLASLTMLPALLNLFGRSAFWPRIPRYRDASTAETPAGIWRKIADFVEVRPRKVWIVTLILLMLGAAFLPTLRATGVSTTDIILGDTDAKQGQRVLDEHFDAGSGSPVEIIVPENLSDKALERILAADGVAGATVTAEDGSPAGIPPRKAEAKVFEGMVYIQATLDDAAESEEAEATVTQLRDDMHKLDADILVGGTTATKIDTNLTGERDIQVIIPLVLLVVWVILIVLLRAILLPTLLIIATVVSFGTAMGTAAIVFNHILKFPGADPSVPLYGFVFLVALGIDYTIFLMTRAREETPALGTRKAVLKSLTVTGGVITSAGIVLAATFAALAVIPLMFMIQLAFIVAYGVLIDTLIVRTLLIPGLVLDIGPAVWWPWRKNVDPQHAGGAPRRALIE